MDDYSFLISKSNVKDLIGNLQKDYNIFGPKKKSNPNNLNGKEFFSFEYINDSVDLCLDYTTSILPPIKIFFPNNEILIRFDNSSPMSAKSIVEKGKSSVFFGVHPCDLHAIHLMDRIFNNKPRDEYYLNRRKDGILVGINCEKPCSDKNLCYDKGTLNAESQLYDIMLWEKDKEYLVKVSSERGKEIIKNNSFFTPFEGDFNNFVKQFNEKQDKNFSKRLIQDIEELSNSVKEAYNSKLWSEIGDKCLSCGSCNMVCPTCYCFEIKDEVNIDLESGYRYRSWDSCQNCDFASVGSGENFREKSSQRNRHRVYKKEVYIPNNYGVSGCVGCGRCNTACIANISLIDIYNRVLVKEII
ncbi:MAG: 4Fe-4S dicluster domain-containing protein [Spirochaetota bacterium]|nr:4Fe-4S dicluster domain-containing protein [Spirochaetota bacterium]